MLAEMMKYTQVADGRIIEIFESNDHVPAKAIYLFNHVLNAQHAWASRILGRDPVYGVWEEHESQEFSRISKDNFELFSSILENVDLTKEVTYTNSIGDTYSNVAKDILFHVFNHSTYHRGQIASLFKGESILPPITDYIMLKREMYL